MHFTKIELYNFGIYRGLHTIELKNQTGVKNITLIGGLNGRGKTTLLDSVFLGLYGRKAVEFVVGKKMAYATVLKDHINKSAMDLRAGIRLSMNMDDEEETTITIDRQWQQTGSRIDTELVILKNGIKDDYLSENWEYYVEEIIPFGIAKFFFFDNEKISQIADDEAFDKIKESIKSLMGITTIESLKGHIEKIRKDKNGKLLKTEAGDLNEQLETINISLEQLRSETIAVQAKRASIVPELIKTENQLEEAENEFWENGGTLSTRRNEILKDQQDLQNRASELREQALSLAANPEVPIILCHALASDTYNRLQQSGNDLAMRYSFPILTRFYNELLKQFSEIYSKGSEAYSSLDDLIHQQMVKIKNEMSQTSDIVFSPLSNSLMERFLTENQLHLRQEAHSIIKESEENQIAQAQLEVHLSNNSEQSEAAQLLQKIKDLQARKAQLEERIAQCDREIGEADRKEKILESQANKITMKIAAQADSTDNSIRIVEYVTMSLEIMEEFTRRLQAQKVNLLEQNISSCFDFLSQKEGLITSITIDPKTLDITLKDYNGGILLKDQLSAGEKQMFAISILWGLALSSGYKLPVIIDTPLARLDSRHRTNFINKYLPNASSQVIVLSTDEEINGKYLDDIRNYVNDAYILSYNEEEKCSSITRGYFGGLGNDM